jgi:clan AA aspartic protease
MVTANMGKVLVPVLIESMEDLFEVNRNRRKPEEVRCIEVADALVDTGATYLSLPQRLVRQLGLMQFRSRRARISSGEVKEFNMFSVVKLTVQGRDCVVEVAEISDDCPVLIGQLPLEALDFVVDPIGQRLIGNPAHGGEHMFDMF